MFKLPHNFQLHVRRHSIKLHAIFFSKTIVFQKTAVVIKFVVLLVIVNDDLSLTIVSIIFNNFLLINNHVFKNDRF